MKPRLGQLRRMRSSLLCVLFLGGCAIPQPQPQRPRPFVGGLQRVIPFRPVAPLPDERAAIRAAGLSTDQVGYALWDVDSRTLLASHQANRPFMPASVTKLVSTVAGLEILGADHFFETTLWRAGELRQGVL